MEATTIPNPTAAGARLAEACRHPAAVQRPLFAARDYITGEAFRLERCGACGLVRTLASLGPDGAAHYYPPGYYGRVRRYNPLLEQVLDWLYSFRTRLIEIASGLEPGQVLDIGCGRGLLLKQLRKRGWQVTGTELGDESARYAREVLQIDVRTGQIGELRFPAEAFDTVILWHVLEHIGDPAELLAEVYRILRPAGTLLVAVPNFGSLEARWSQDHWFHLDVPRHQVQFTAPTLRAYLLAAGLRPRMVSYLATEYDFFSFVQTGLNLAGVRHNLLYNWLRSQGAKVLTARDEAARPRDIAVTLLLTPVLGLISLVWVPLVALLGRGATVTMYAKKPRR